MSTIISFLVCVRAPSGLLEIGNADRRNHDLRYVLKDRETGNVFFVVLFTLVHKDDVEKEEAEAKTKMPEGHKAADESKDKAQEVAFEPKDDDLD